MPVSGSSNLSESMQDALENYLQKNHFTEKMMKKATCRISKNGNLLLKVRMNGRDVEQVICHKNDFLYRDIFDAVKKAEIPNPGNVFVDFVYALQGNQIVIRPVPGEYTVPYSTFMCVLNKNSKAEEVIHAAQNYTYLRGLGGPWTQEVMGKIISIYPEEEISEILQYADDLPFLLSKDERTALEKMKQRNVSIEPAPEKFRIIYCGVPFTYDYSDVSMSAHYKAVIRKLRYLAGHIEVVRKIRKAADGECGGFHGTVATVMGISVDLEAPDTQALKELQAAVKRKHTEEQRAKREAAKKYETEMRECGIYGNILAREIYRLVRNNETHITENVVVQMLRGSMLRSSYAYRKPENCCPALSSETVHRMIRVMVRKGFLREKTVKGTYGRYEVLVCGKPLPDVTPSKKYADYTDEDWESFLKKGEKIPWRDIRPLLEHENVVAFCEEDFIGYFSDAPENILEYMKMCGNKVLSGVADKIKNNYITQHKES